MKPRAKYIAPLFLFLFTANITAQWKWSRHLYSENASIIEGIAADDDMNLYLSGQCKTDIHLDPDNIMSSFGNTDFFIAKYDSSGNYLDSIQAYSPGQKVRPKNVVIDPSGNIISNGFYNGAVTGDFILAAPNGWDAFTVKFNSDMSLNWIDAATGPSDIKSQYVAADPSGNIYATGFSDSVINIKTETLLDDPDTNYIQNYIVKYLPNGDLDWVTQIKTASNDAKFIQISAPNSNEIYVVGYFTDTLYAADTVVIYAETPLVNTGVLIKLNGDGDVKWARKMGGSNYDRCNGVDTDASGNVYITGVVSGTVTFDSTGSTPADASTPITTAGNSWDFFVAKYSPGGILQWKYVNGSTGVDIGNGAHVFENIVQFAGTFSGDVYFNTDVISSESTLDEDAGFFVYDTDGNPITGKSVQGSAADRSEQMAYDEAGNTYFSAIFQSNTLEFGDSTYTNGVQSGSNNNVAFGKYSFDFQTTWTKQKHVTCNGGTDGELVVSTHFGTGPYTYDWTSPDTSIIESDDSSAYNLTAGRYMVEVTDVNSKVSSTTLYTITEPDVISATTDSTNLSCFESNDGTITISSTNGGTAPYTYAWSGPSGDDPTNPNQIDLSAGTYNLVITDANLCAGSEVVEITQPDPIYFGNVVVVPEEPSLSTFGSIDLEVSGGTPAYTYAWVYETDSLIGRTNDTLNNLTEGDYKAYVTDQNLCVTDTIITVAGDSLRVNLVGTNVSCVDSTDGSAYATTISGRKGFNITYSFEDATGTPITPTNDSILLDLAPGTYFVTAQEQGGENRSATDSVVIEEPLALNLILDADSVQCYGSTNGLITLTASGGTGGYTYDWSNGETSKNISNLSAGIYTVTVTDANSCNISGADTVYQPDSIEIAFTEIQIISCFGGSNGILLATPSGGITPYTYQWNDARTQITAAANLLEAGTYSVIITDANNCSNNDNYNLDQPELLVLESLSISDISCYDSTNGSIIINASGGLGSYNYNWSNDLVDTNMTSNIFNGLAYGLYDLILTDSMGCQIDSIDNQVQRPTSRLTLTEDAGAHSDNDCFGGIEGSLSVIASGGWTSSYEYSIELNNWQGSPTFSNLGAQEYSISVKDNNNCVQSANIDILEAPEIEIISANVFGNTVSISATGGTQGLSYFLNGGGTPQATGTFPDLTNGTYFIEITDNNNCGPIRSGDLTIDGNSISETLNEVVNLYPNPSNGLFKLEIEVPDDGEFNLEIYSITGVKVHSEVIFGQAHEFKQVNIDLSENSKGIYLVNINGVTLNSKLILE